MNYPNVHRDLSIRGRRGLHGGPTSQRHHTSSPGPLKNGCRTLPAAPGLSAGLILTSPDPRGTRLERNSRRSRGAVIAAKAAWKITTKSDTSTRGRANRPPPPEFSAAPFPHSCRWDWRRQSGSRDRYHSHRIALRPQLLRENHRQTDRRGICLAGCEIYLMRGRRPCLSGLFPRL
jgi:hypothetical protein